MLATSRSRQLLFVVFLFFYVPIAYYWGWVLTYGVAFDFPSFYHAAQLAFVDGDSPYGPSAFKIASLGLGRKVHPYLYPPPSLIVFWPFANLSILQAQTALLAVSHLCYLSSLWLILAKLTPLALDQRLREIVLGISLIYMLFFDAVLKTFALGQVNLIVLFFVCLALVALKENASPWRIALPLSIAILIKTYPILLFAPLLFRRKFRAIALTCAYFAVFTGIALLIVPAVAWKDWFFQVLPAGGYANNAISAAFVWNQSLNALVTRLLVTSEFNQAPLPLPALAKPLATALALLVVSVTVFLSYRLSRRGSYQISGDDEIAGYLLMIFLVAPLSWDHHLVYVLPAAILAISLLVTTSIGRGATVALAAALLIMAWNVPIDHPDLQHGWWTLLISVKLYTVVALWLFFMDRLRRATGLD